jgi:hypothetical protein
MADFYTFVGWIRAGEPLSSYCLFPAIQAHVASRLLSN